MKAPAPCSPRPSTALRVAFAALLAGCDAASCGGCAIPEITFSGSDDAATHLTAAPVEAPAAPPPRAEQAREEAPPADTRAVASSQAPDAATPGVRVGAGYTVIDRVDRSTGGRAPAGAGAEDAETASAGPGDADTETPPPPAPSPAPALAPVGVVVVPPDIPAPRVNVAQPTPRPIAPPSPPVYAPPVYSPPFSPAPVYAPAPGR